jgi:hypothetical protein
LRVLKSVIGFLTTGAVCQRSDTDVVTTALITALALRLFSMTHGLQQIVRPVKHHYSLVIYGLPPLRYTFGHPQPVGAVHGHSAFLAKVAGWGIAGEMRQ